jgi:hypothetical protein
MYPGASACKDFKHQMTGYILELSQSTGVPEPRELAESLALLLEGSIVTAQVAGNPDSADIARKAASVLIENALGNAVMTA